MFEDGRRFVEVATFAHRFTAANMRPMRMRLVLLLLDHGDVLSFTVQLRVLLGQIDLIFLGVLIGSVRLYFAQRRYLMRITLFFLGRRYV